MDSKELIDRLTTEAITALANDKQVTEWLRRNGFESFEALVEELSKLSGRRRSEQWRD